MNKLQELQAWYKAQCDGDWEHGHGVTISTLDNPGWSLVVNLIGTNLQTKEFEAVSYGLGLNSDPEDQNWLVCKAEGGQFQAYGGPTKLDEMLDVFIRWSK